MTDTNWSHELDLLRAKGVTLSSGLTADEIDEAEATFGFRFPPDLRSFLALALPVSNGFPDWRARDLEALTYRLDWPFEGIRFDIENAGFWLRDWGPRPTELAKAIELAREKIRDAPKLIPIYSHRFIPDEPLESGNPVLSVVQTDIIYYGRDLQTYFAHEFGGVGYVESVTPEPRHIRFWSDLTS